MSTSAIEIDTTNADRCNRQARVVPTDTIVKFGEARLALGAKIGVKNDGFDLYEVTFVAKTVETAVFSSSFVATYFFEQSLLNRAAIMAKVTGSIQGTVTEDYRAADGALVVLGTATWTRG